MFKMMLDNCDPDDLEQLHDILTMMAEAIDKINEAMPSTAVLAGSRLVDVTDNEE